MKRFILAIVLLAMLFGCTSPSYRVPSRSKKIEVVTTLFPLYDFAREVGGDRVHVTLLIPPGVEPHDFEPRPSTMRQIAHANVFIYTNKYMEPWVEQLLAGVARKVHVVDASVGIPLIRVKPSGVRTSDAGHVDHGPAPHGYDPHIWLDLRNAQIMVDTIARALAEADPEGQRIYYARAAVYTRRLHELDRKYFSMLNRCPINVFVHAGHYAFGYMAKRYSLRYIAAYGISPNAEPTPKHLAELLFVLRWYRLKYVFYEEVFSPRVARLLAHETGAELILLNAGHEISHKAFRSGITYIDIMEQNLQNLVRGLQ